MGINVKVTAVIVAGGRGNRMGKGYNKQYIKLKGKPILAYTLDAFQKSKSVGEIILVVGEGEIKFCESEIVGAYGFTKVVSIVSGGVERQDSVLRGLEKVSSDCDVILIHDGARPFLTQKMIDSSIEKANEQGGAIVAVPVKDTIKRVNQELQVVETPLRETLWSVQTPQAFQSMLLRRAYNEALKNGWKATDDAMLVEMLGYPVVVVEGSYSNIKITTPEDLIIAEKIIEGGK